MFQASCSQILLLSQRALIGELFHRTEYMKQMITDYPGGEKKGCGSRGPSDPRCRAWGLQVPILKQQDFGTSPEVVKRFW